MIKEENEYKKRNKTFYYWRQGYIKYIDCRKEYQEWLKLGCEEVKSGIEYHNINLSKGINNSSNNLSVKGGQK